MRNLIQSRVIRKTGTAISAALLMALLAIAACEKDRFDQVIENEAAASSYPVPGNNGLLNISDIRSSSLKIAWAPALDDKTVTGNLQYRIIKLSLGDIDALFGTVENGEVVVDWTGNIQNADITGLNPGERVFFNVQVRDSEGLSSAYLPASVTTNLTDTGGSAGPVYIFAAGERTGDMILSSSTTPRSDLDAVCSASKDTDFPGLATGTTRAFISISSSDSIRDFPANYNIPEQSKIVSATGVVLGYSWADILDGSVNKKLLDAGISTQSWWSGSYADGSFNSAETCSGWTDGTSSFQGTTGIHNVIDEGWIANTARNCNNQMELLCVSW